MNAFDAPVTLCIVNFQGMRHLPAALAAARGSATAFAEILVVDNASTDGSAAWLRREHPDVRLLALDHNRGPAGARNAGFEAATHDLILFQDNDVQLDSQCAGAMLEALQQSVRVLLAAPRVLYAGNPTVVQYDSADCHFLGLMVTRNANRPFSEVSSAASTTTSLVTSCFVIDRKRWHGGPLFDEWFGFNYEDHDFGVRACAAGHELVIEPAARVLHGSGTPQLSYRPGGPVARERVFYLIRNRWSVLTKSYAARSLVVLAPILLSYELFQFAGAARKGWLGPWFAALRSWWRELPRLRRERRSIQQTRRCGDRIILRGGPLPLTVASTGGRIAHLAVRSFDGIANAYWRLARPLL